MLHIMAAIGFDVDHTLIRPTGGRRFYDANSSWEWTHPDVPARVAGAARRLDAAVWICTSQRWKKQADVLAAMCRIAEVKRRLETAGAAEVEVSVALAEHPHMRKPSPLLWSSSASAQSGRRLLFFCGDDDGEHGGRKGHDILLAHNCGVAFVPAPLLYAADYDNSDLLVPRSQDTITPLGRVLCVEPRSVAASVAIALASAGAMELATGFPLVSRVGVVLAGAQGVGKSRLATALRDFFGAQVMVHDEHSPALKKQLRAPAKMVVADRTHPDAAMRDRTVTALRDAGVGIILLVAFVTAERTAKELNFLRCVETRGAKHVPAVAEGVFWRRCDFGLHKSPPDAKKYDRIILVRGTTASLSRGQRKMQFLT